MRAFVLCFAGFLLWSLVSVNGICQENQFPNWKVEWYEMKGEGLGPLVTPPDFGRKVGEGSFPFIFYNDWGSGPVYKHYDDHIGFKAFLELEIPVPITIDLEVGADDGVRLYIDDNPNPVIKLWEQGEYRELRTMYPFTAGRHRLELDYFEWTGVAKVKFSADIGDLLLLGRLKSLTENLLKLQTTIESAIQTMTKQLLEQRSNVDDVVKELQKLLAMKTQVEALQGKIEALEQQMHSVAQDVSQQSELLEVLEEKLASIEPVISGLENAVTEITQTMQEAISTLQQETRSISQNVSELSGALDALGKRLDSLESKIGDLANAVQEITETIKAEVLVPRDSWKVCWYEMTEPGVFGQSLGTSSFPLNFFFNWGYGQIFQNRYDHVGFKAYAKIFLPRDTFCRFKVFANNCFTLYIDGRKVLEHWGMGEALPPEEKFVELLLAAGEHDLELHYYEWEGEAWISFYQW
jgi:predicted  nucleic acid-binding Zn-ribbon protein